MAGRRLEYLLVLAAGLCFQVMYEGYLAGIVFLTILAMPVVSLTLTLAAVWGAGGELMAHPREAVREESGVWRLCVRSRLPLAGVKVTFVQENRMTGQRRQCSALWRWPRNGQGDVPLWTEHCGVLTGQVFRLRVVDYLGLFALPLRLPEPAAAVVLPRDAADAERQGTEGEETWERPGGQSGGEYELREYRPGDPLRSIHWKRTAGRETPVVREWQSARSVPAALTFELSGDLERNDRVLDRVYTLARRFGEAERLCLLCWETEQQTVCCPVSSEEDLRDCFVRLLSVPLSAFVPPPERLPAGAERVHVDGKAGDHGER